MATSKPRGGSNTANLLATGILIVGGYIFYRRSHTHDILHTDVEKSPYTRYRIGLADRIDQEELKRYLETAEKVPSVEEGGKKPAN